MESLAQKLPVQPVIQLSVWEDFVQYTTYKKTQLTKWSGIKEIGFELFDDKNFLFVITLRKRFPVKGKNLLLFNPQMEKLLETLHSKATIADSNEMQRFLQKLLKKTKDQEEKTARKQKKKEALATKKLDKKKAQAAKKLEKKKAKSPKTVEEKTENPNKPNESPEKPPSAEKPTETGGITEKNTPKV